MPADEDWIRESWEWLVSVANHVGIDPPLGDSGEDLVSFLLAIASKSDSLDADTGGHILLRLLVISASSRNLLRTTQEGIRSFLDRNPAPVDQQVAGSIAEYLASLTELFDSETRSSADHYLGSMPAGPQVSLARERLRAGSSEAPKPDDSAEQPLSPRTNSERSSDQFFDAVEPILLQNGKPTATFRLMIDAAGTTIGRNVRIRSQAEQVAVAYIHATATRVAQGKFSKRELNVATTQAAAVISSNARTTTQAETLALTLALRRGAAPAATEVKEVLEGCKSPEDVAVRVLVRILANTLVHANDGDNTLARSVVDGAEAMGEFLTHPDAVEITNLLTRFDLPSSIGMEQLVERADPRNRAELLCFSADDRSAMYLAEQQVQVPVAVAVCRRNSRPIVDQSRSWIVDQLGPQLGSYLPPRMPHPATVKKGKAQPALELAVAQRAIGGDPAAAREAKTALARFNSPAAEEWDAFLELQLNGALYASDAWQRIENPTHEVHWNRAVFDDSQQFDRPTAYRHLEAALATESPRPATLLYALYLVLGTAVNADVDDEIRGVAQDFVVKWAPSVPESRVALAALAFGSTDTSEASVSMRSALGQWARLAEAPDPFPFLPNQVMPFKSRIESLQSDKRYPTNWLRLILTDIAAHRNDYRAPSAAALLGAIAEQSGDQEEARRRYRQGLRMAVRNAVRARGEGSVRATQLTLRSSAKEAVDFATRHSDTALASEVERAILDFPGADDANQISRKVAVVVGKESTTSRSAIGRASASTEVPKPLLDLMPEIVSARTIAGVAQLSKRIHAAMVLAKTPEALSEPARECLNLVDRLSTAVPASELPRLTEELAKRVNELQLVIESHSDQSLAALAGAIRRAGETVATEMANAPVPTVTLNSDFAGLSRDTALPEIVIDVSGPNDSSLSDVELHSAGQRRIQIGTLEPGAIRTVALPIDPAGPSPERTINIEVSWTWGLVSSRKLGVVLKSPVVSWDGLLADAGLGGKQLPDRLVSDYPLDLNQVRSGLFQGRADHIQYVRDEFAPGRTPSQPLCFHGTRKVGKSSLLNRVRVELEDTGRHVIEVTASGIHAATSSLEDAVGLLCVRLSAACTSELPLVPARPDNPVLFFEQFLNRIATGESAGEQAPVIIIDEFQCLYQENAGPLLDVVRLAAESRKIGFIFAATEGPSGFPKNSNLLVVPRRVDFLDGIDVERLLEAAYDGIPLSIPSNVRAALFDAAAGHPNFTAMLAKEALALTNAGQRNVVTFTDVADATERIAEREYLFETSWFDRTVLDADARQAAIDLAHSLSRKRGWMSLETTKSLLGPGALALVHTMDAAFLVETDRSHENEIQIRIRGGVLEAFLRRQFGEHLLPSPDTRQNAVGLFCDIENVAKGSADGPDILAERLARFAKRFGSLAIGEAVVTQYSIGNIGWDMREVDSAFALHAVRVQEPTGGLEGKASAADFVLSPLITQATEQYNLSDIVLVSGDHSFVGSASVVLGGQSLSGRRVHAVSMNESRSRGWFKLAEERSLTCQVAGLDGPDLVIWNLDAVLDDPEGSQPETPMIFP